MSSSRNHHLIAGATLLLFLLSGCTFRMPSNPITDFVAKDGADPSDDEIGRRAFRSAILELPSGIKERAWKVPALNRSVVKEISDAATEGLMLPGPDEGDSVLPPEFFEPPPKREEGGQTDEDAEAMPKPDGAGGGGGNGGGAKEQQPPPDPGSGGGGESGTGEEAEGASEDLEFEDEQDTPVEEELFIGLGSAPEVALEERPVDEVDPYIGTLIPLPVIATDPNSGITGGVLPVVVFREYERITSIMAPSFTFNELEGFEGMFRLRRYPDRTSELLIDAGASTEGAHDYEISYTSLNLPPGNLYGTVTGRFFQELSDRYFGLGNDTEEEAETTYTHRELAGNLTLGVTLPYNFDFEIRESYRMVELRDGKIDDLAQLEERFPDTPGLDDPVEILTHGAAVIYDTRDSKGTPTEGIYFRFGWEIGINGIASDFTFQRFDTEFKFLIPWLDKMFVTAGRLRYVHTEPTEQGLPFFYRSVLGGKETNRGFGYGRFWDNDVVLVNLEQRYNIVAFTLMDVEVILQTAAFVDIGRLFNDLDELDDIDRGLHIAGGVAIRLIVPDSDLVTSIDVGLSDEGSAAFVGLGYPF